MHITLRLGLALCLLSLSACLQDDEETSGWFCGFYNTCAKPADNMCAFYGNCPGSGGTVWGPSNKDSSSKNAVNTSCSFYGNCEGSGSVWGSSGSSGSHSDGGSVWGPAHSDSGDGTH